MSEQPLATIQQPSQHTPHPPDCPRSLEPAPGGKWAEDSLLLPRTRHFPEKGEGGLEYVFCLNFFTGKCFKMARNDLTAERLREVLDYDCATGIFRWRLSLSNTGQAGTVAGSTNKKGYVRISIDGVLYYAQRLAWLYVKGVWPAAGVDHEDLNPSHNWFDNLREASQLQNLKNIPRHKDNQSGYKGVIFDKARGKFRAEIMTEGKKKFLGRFDTALEAHAAYSGASLQQHGEFGRAA